MLNIETDEKGKSFIVVGKGRLTYAELQDLEKRGKTRSGKTLKDLRLTAADVRAVTAAIAQGGSRIWEALMIQDSDD